MGKPGSVPRLRQPSRRTFLSGVLAGGTALGLSGCGIRVAETTTGPAPIVEPGLDGDLVFFNWGSYIAPELLRGFEDEYGVRVHESNFNSMDDMITRIRSGNAYDIIFPSAKWASRLVEAGQLMRIDREALDNIGLVGGDYEYFNDPWYDSGSEHTVPYTMYFSGILHRRDSPYEMTGSWNDLWADQAANHIYNLDDRDEVLAMAALRHGFNINTTDTNELLTIQADLLEQRDALRGYSSDPFTHIEAGNAWLQHAWSGNLVTLRGQVNDPDTYAFQRCAEGSPITTDTMAIPTNAEHPRTAALFIDYMLRPENAIVNMEYLGFAMPNTGAQGAYDQVTEEHPELRLTMEDLQGDTLFEDPGVQGDQNRNEVWTAVRAS